MQGAGGTNGGVGSFFLGLVMMAAGGYMFLGAINVSHGFSMGYRIYSVGSVSITSGMTLIPLIFGIGLIFYNSRNVAGWILSSLSAIFLFFGIIASLRFNLRQMTAFELITIVVLIAGGLGLFLSALRSHEKP